MTLTPLWIKSDGLASPCVFNDKKKVDSAIGKMRKVNLQENDSPWLLLSINHNYGPFKYYVL